MGEKDYPTIRAVRLSDGNFYPWSGLQGVPGHHLEFEPKWVCAVRDVLDGMVLNLKNRRGARANDLSLREEHGEWQVQSVDTSPHALIRHLTRGL